MEKRKNFLGPFSTFRSTSGRRVGHDLGGQMRVWTQIWYAPQGGTPSLLWINCHVKDLPWTVAEQPDDEDWLQAWVRNNQLSDADPIQFAASGSGFAQANLSLGSDGGGKWLADFGDRQFWPRMEVYEFDNGDVISRRYHGKNERTTSNVIVPTWGGGAGNASATLVVRWYFPCSIFTPPETETRMWVPAGWLNEFVVPDSDVPMLTPGVERTPHMEGTSSGTVFYEAGWAQELLVEANNASGSRGAWHLVNRARNGGSNGTRY